MITDFLLVCGKCDRALDRVANILIIMSIKIFGYKVWAGNILGFVHLSLGIVKGSDHRSYHSAKIGYKVFSEVRKDKKHVGNSWRMDDFQTEKLGTSSGYIALHLPTNETFILKHFYKKHQDCLREFNHEQQKNARNDRKNCVRILLTSTIYQLLLSDKVPQEGIVSSNTKNPNSLYIYSKFFKNAVPMADFMSNLNTNQKLHKLTRVKGFEKIVAASNLLGEIDYHKKNIMVQIQRNERGKKKYAFTKIDHGRSLIGFSQDFATMIGNIAERFKRFHYDTLIADGDLLFNIDKFSNSLKQMTNQFNADKIDSIIKQKIAMLKKIGFDPNGLKVRYSFKELESIYKKLLRKNLNNMKKISKQIIIICKFENVSKEFKNGRWLKDFVDSGFKDPIEYAVHNNIKIGSDALLTAKLM
jgi:hypothetical protein